MRKISMAFSWFGWDAALLSVTGVLKFCPVGSLKKAGKCVCEECSFEIAGQLH